MSGAIVCATLLAVPSLRAAITTNATTLSVGVASGDNNNVLTFTNATPATTWAGLTSGQILIGSSATPLTVSSFGGSYNTVIVSNVVITVNNQQNYLGGSSGGNNTFTLLAGTVLSGTGNGVNFTIGAKPNQSSIATNNILSVLSGAIISNVTIMISSNVASGAMFNNGLIVSNGGFAQLRGLDIGYIPIGFGGISNNFAYISNINVSAANQISRGAITIGSGGGQNNTGTLANVIWAGGGGTISVGSGQGLNGSTIGNGLTVNNGSLLTNFTGIGIGYAQYAVYSGFTNISNAMTVEGPRTILSTSGSMVVGGATGGNGRGAGGGGSSNNFLRVISGATVLTTNLFVGLIQNLGNGANNGGTAVGVRNSVVVSGAGSIYTNHNDTVIGLAINSTAYGNYSENAGNNSLLVTNGGSMWTRTLSVGVALDIAGSLATSANNNRVLVDDGSMYVQTLRIGGTNVINFPVLGTLVNAGGANAAANGNSLTLTNNSLLEVATSMVILPSSAGSGNTISNFGSTFQFTSPTVTITPNGFGNIYMTNGTISYRAINNGDVTFSTNGVSNLAGIKIEGTTSFMLNAASNTLAAAGQNYTFQTGGSAANYVNLIMVNGQTAYGNGDVTIGTGGSLLSSNTTASFQGVFTNQNTASFANGISRFNSNAFNSGTWTIASGTNTFFKNLDNAGTLSQTGSVVIVGTNLINQASGVYSVVQNGATYVAGTFTNLGSVNIGQSSIFTNGNAFLSGASTFRISDTGSIWSNLQLTVGNSGSFASAVVSNGANLFSSALIVGNGASNNTLFLGGGVNAISSSNGLITVGAAGGGFNSLTATNASINSGGLTIGNGSSNNTVTVLNGVTWTLRGGALTFGNGTGNALNIIPGGASVLTNIGGITLQDGGRSLFITNATGARTMILGTGGAFLIGNTAGLGNDSLTLSNQSYIAGAVDSVIGLGSSNNALTLLANTVWSNAARSVTIGSGSANANTLTLKGGLLTNSSSVIVGTGGGSFNSVLVTNGGSLFFNTMLQIGSGVGGSNNTVTVTGAGSQLRTANTGTIVVGAPGSSGNGLIVGAGASLVSSNIHIGSTNDSNGNFYNIGGAGAASTVTNGLVSIGAGVITPQFFVFNAGGSYNSMTITNANLVSGRLSGGVGVTIGMFSSNNSATVLADAVWDMSGGSLALGFLSGNNNSLVINGGVVTNTGAVAVGDRASGTGTTSPNFNTLLLTNGAQLWSSFDGNVPLTPGSMIGNGGTSNTVTVTGANSLWNLSDVAVLVVGANGTTVDPFSNVYGGSTGNVLNVFSGGTVIATSVVISATETDFGNQINVDGGRLIITNAAGTGTLIVGQSGQGRYVASGTSTTTVDQLIVTNSGGYVNSYVFNGGVLNVSTSQVDNGSSFVVGDGVHSATLNLLGSGNYFADGVTNSVNGTITGTGTISGGRVVNQGLITVTNGTLALNNGLLQNALVTIAGGANAGTLNVGVDWTNNGIISNRGGTISGGILTNQGIIVGFGTNDLIFVNGSLANLIATNGTLQLAAVTVNNGFVRISNGSTLDVGTDWSNNGTVTNLGGFLVGAGTLTNKGLYIGLGTNIADFVNGAAGTLVVSNGTLGFTGSLTNGGFVRVTSGSTLNVATVWVNDGIITNLGGTIAGNTLNNTGTIVGNGTIASLLANSSTGFLQVTNGTTTLSLAPDNQGNIDVATGGTLVVTPAWSNDGTLRIHTAAVVNSAGGLTNTGIVSLQGGTITGGAFVNQASVTANGGLINTTLRNEAGAFLNVASGALTVTPMVVNLGIITNTATLQVGATGTGSMTNTGIFVMNGGTFISGQVTNAGTLTGFGAMNAASVLNSGTILAKSPGALNFGGSFLVNLAGGMITGNTGQVVINGAFTNIGTMTLVASTATFNSPIVRNLGSLIVNNASTISASGTVITNTATGVIILKGGTIVDDDLVNQGHISSTGGLISNALINVAGAFIDIVSGVTTATPDLVNFGTVTNSATFQIGSAGSGTITNFGTIYLNAGVLISGQITNTGLIAGRGTVSGPILNNGGTVLATNGTLQLTGAASGASAYSVVAGSSAATLTFSGGGSISSLFNTGATVRIASLVTNAGANFVNAGTLAILTATYVHSGALNNLNTGIITGSTAGLTIGGALTNSGIIALRSSTISYNKVRNFGFMEARDSTVTVNGIFSNSAGGTVSFFTSVGTFTSAVVNNGAWITDPSTNIFQGTYTLDNSGSIVMTYGDVFVFTNNGSTVGNFLNKSIESNTTDMVNGKFVFSGTLGITQSLATAGGNIGNLSLAHDFSQALVPTLNTTLLAQYSNNFAVGELYLSGSSTTLVYDALVAGGRSHNSLEAALFLDTLTLDPDVQLIISNNVQVYFVNSNGFSQAQVTLLGNSGLHQLVTSLGIVPEPNVLLMWFCGAFTVWAARRRRRSK